MKLIKFIDKIIGYVYLCMGVIINIEFIQEDKGKCFLYLGICSVVYVLVAMFFYLITKKYRTEDKY